LPSIQIRCFGGSFWPPQPSQESAPIWSLYLSLQFTQWLPRTEIENGQFNQFRVLWAHACQKVPFYQNSPQYQGLHFEDLQSLADIRKFPILSRSEYQANFVQFQAQQLPAEVSPGGEESTSGTSGIPVRVRHSNVTQRWWRALYLRDLEWSGLDQFGKFAVIRPLGRNPEEAARCREGVTQPHWSPGLANLIETGPCFGMDIHQLTAKQLSWLQEVNPDYLVTYPSNAESLALKWFNQGKPVENLKSIQLIGESLTEEAKYRIESTFQVPVNNIYSSAEAGYIASRCQESGDQLFVHAESVLVEILNEQDEPCQPGETGRVVLTTLHNFVNPLIRYDIGDEATVGEPSTCGRGLPTLKSVSGKRRPLIRYPDGQLRSSVDLVVNLRKSLDYLRHQIIQKSDDSFLIRIVPKSLPGSAEKQAVENVVYSVLKGQVPLTIEFVDDLKPLPVGKFVEILVEPKTE
jgi:phenylacetate-CoA ligase